MAVLAAFGAPADTVMPAGVATQKTVYGDVLADSRKMTLYAFDQDNAGKSACTGECADVRTPLAAPRIGRPVGDWTILTRDDGSKQWAYKGKPLYSFTGDRAPGDLSGDGGDWKAAMVGPVFMPAGVTIKTTDYGPTFANLGRADALYGGQLLLQCRCQRYAAPSDQPRRHRPAQANVRRAGRRSPPPPTPSPRATGLR